MFDYFYGEQSEQFSFYRIPKILFTDESFKGLSAEAKVLYGILLDRMSLSTKNGWMDPDGRVYIIFTTEEVMNAMHCADNKATKLLAELENKAGLIVRKRMGLGRPNRIYVKNFVAPIDPRFDERFRNRENNDSGGGHITCQESSESRCNNTDMSNTEYSDTESFSSIRKGSDAMDTYDSMRAYFEDALDMDVLKCDCSSDAETLDGILDLVTDVCTSDRSFIRVAGEDKPAEVVKSRFMKLNSEHIRYVLASLKDNTTRIRDPKQYLIAALYNAPATMKTYYRSWANSNEACR